MYIFLRNLDIRTINMLIRFYSLSRKSHYEILRLRKNCSDKEIKEAYIKLSKEYHPDKNKDVNAQQQFVRIVEAYHVLGKPSSRAQYDHTVSHYTTPRQTYHRTQQNTYNMRYGSSHSQYEEAYNRSTSQGQSAKPKDTPYYGVHGIDRVPNYILVFMCFGIAFIGCVLQAVVIRDRYVRNKRQAVEKSILLAEELERVRARAQENTNEEHTRILLEKIVGSSNPTIATASLGQALALEKKENTSESVLSDLVINDVTNAWCQNAQEPKQHLTFTDIVRKIRMYYYYYSR